jgi:hypothetical protein
MSALKSLADAKPGQRLSFAYYGGSDFGTTRQVDVDEVLDDRILGTDVAKDEPRQYLFDKAAIVVVISEPQPVPAEAACDVPVTDVLSSPTTRVRRTPMSFVDARQRLHDQIDELNGEDLAEVLAEVDGMDRGQFDAPNGQVVLERDVLVPHCTLNLTSEVASVDWVNEDGVPLTIVSSKAADDNHVELTANGEAVAAEDCVRKLAEHFGLTISEGVL